MSHWSAVLFTRLVRTETVSTRCLRSCSQSSAKDSSRHRQRLGDGRSLLSPRAIVIGVRSHGQLGLNPVSMQHTAPKGMSNSLTDSGLSILI